MDVLLSSPERLLERFLAARDRSRSLFSLLIPDAFDLRPIPLRQSFRFYEGHLAAFNANLLAEAGCDVSCLGADIGKVFARGIDPDSSAEAAAQQLTEWPSRERVLDYANEVDQIMLSALDDVNLADELAACIEHEEMHQETLVYMLHQLPGEHKVVPADYELPLDTEAGLTSANKWVAIPAGMTELGTRPENGFGWDNEFPRTPVFVGDFEIQSHKISNGEFQAFVEAGGYEQSALWSRAAWKRIRQEGWHHPQSWRRSDEGWRFKGVFAEFPLPLSWPVLVSFDEANAYANWKSWRLPTEAEFGRAAHPAIGAGDAGHLPAAAVPGNFDFRNWEFRSVSAGAVHENGLTEMVGNGWEWTSTLFTGLPGFKPMPHYPAYSAAFFDGLHYVLKGASPVTAGGLVRPGFRNWFRHHYRYAYTTFRCVRETAPAKGRVR